MSKVKEYTVADFCKQYKNAGNEKVKELFIKEVMKTGYVDYQTKITVCKMIIDSSYFNKVKINGIEQKTLHVDSTSKYMLYCLNLIKYYTNIKIDFKNSLEEFNMLNKLGVLDEINKCIPERELKEFKMVLNMIESDVIQNEYEIHAFIGKQVDRILDVFAVISKPTSEQLSNLINTIDKDTLISAITNIGKNK